MPAETPLIWTRSRSRTYAPSNHPSRTKLRVCAAGDREGESFISPEVQEKAILDWAARHERPVVIREHELNVSGGTMDRPVFNQLMERVRQGESGGIVVWKSDRFARSLIGAVTTLAELETAATMVPDDAEREGAIRALAEAHAALEDFRKDTAARRKLGAAWHEWLDEYLADVREAQVALDRHAGFAELAGSEGLARDHYLSLPTPERREVLGGFIDAVVVRRSRGKGRHVEPTPERTRILWRGEGPHDLPVQRRINEIKPFDFGEGDVEAGVAAAKAAA